MHPLEKQLEQKELGEEQLEKRRSSLDNSSLTFDKSLDHLVSEMGPDFKISRKPRRLSLENGVTVPTTFLANDNPEKSSKHSSLDVDRHVGDRRTSSQKSGVFGDDDSLVGGPDHIFSMHEDDSFNNSMYDSFANASVMEQPNKDYLKKDLGASCISMGLGDESSIMSTVNEDDAMWSDAILENVDYEEPIVVACDEEPIAVP